MPISMFTTRTMLRMMEQMLPARKFLRETFFSTLEIFDTEKVDIDIIKGKRRMAPFVSPKIGGKTVERRGYTTETYKPPMVSPNMITTAENILKRSPGENIYNAKSPSERAAEQLGKDIAEMDEMITRREEWMCSQALFTGQIHVIGEGVDEVINFGLTHDGVLAAGSKWNESTSNPNGTLKEMRREIIKDSGVNPNVVVMGYEAIDAYINHEKVKDSLDTRRIDLGKIEPQQLPDGVTYYGYSKESGLDIYGYDEWYLADDGNEYPMVPATKILMGSTNARTMIAYGAVVLAEGEDQLIGYAGERIPDSWVKKQPAARFLQLNSRPLPVPVQIDAFSIREVL